MPPDVTGQPAWVVIVLAVLALAGTVTVAWLTARNRKSATQAEAEQATLTPGGAQDASVQVVQSALDHLARIADREAEESADARRETAKLRAALERVKGQLDEAKRRADQAEAGLLACREHAALLSKQAWRRGDE